MLLSSSRLATATLCCLHAVSVAAQFGVAASPSNATYAQPTDPESHILLEVSNSTELVAVYSLQNLTANATTFLQPDPATKMAYTISGTLRLRGEADLNTTVGTNDLPLVSCDGAGGSVDVGDIVNNAALNNVSAIVLYSSTSAACGVTGSLPNSLNTIYSLVSTNNAQMLLAYVAQGNVTGTIQTEAMQRRMAGSGSGGGGGTFGGLGGPTTAVAMIILYSITGVITALFLIIIVSGAVRAHRHPERYGPRNGVGRTRQSRAKGIARAMLETIPIVKFGDNAPAKDVEMPETGGARGQEAALSTTDSPAARPAETISAAPAAAATTTANTTAANPAGDDDDNTVTCSICTEDFEKGQDTRVLPCNHKFHPACVDPWLLDVSGTCPLCRVDLRAGSDDDATQQGGAADGGDMPPPLDPTADSPTSSGGRLRGLLRRLQPATAEERIAALRRFRQENARANGAAADGITATEENHASRWERVRRRVRM